MKASLLNCTSTRNSGTIMSRRWLIRFLSTWKIQKWSAIPKADKNHYVRAKSGWEARWSNGEKIINFIRISSKLIQPNLSEACLKNLSYQNFQTKNRFRLSIKSPWSNSNHKFKTKITITLPQLLKENPVALKSYPQFSDLTVSKTSDDNRQRSMRKTSQ